MTKIPFHSELFHDEKTLGQLKGQLATHYQKCMRPQVEKLVAKLTKDKKYAPEQQKRIADKALAVVRSKIESKAEEIINEKIFSPLGVEYVGQSYHDFIHQVSDHDRDRFVKNISSTWRNYRGGNFWASWYAYISFLRDVCGWDNPALIPYGHDERHALNAGWCWYGENLCAISDRPESLELDEEGRLHNDDGPAVRWRDGYSLWSIHGVRVDEQIVMAPHTQTIEDIKREPNEEVRRIRIERFGWAKFLRDSGAKEIDKRFNERDMQYEILYELEDKTMRFICSDPSTGRRYALGIPRGTKTCQEAQNWMHHDLDVLAIHRS